MKICNKAHSIESIDNHYLVRTNNADIKIVFMTDEIVRIRASFSKEMEEASYILSLTAWKDRLDAMFSDEERTRISGIKPAVTESDDCVEFLTSSVKLAMKKEPLGFKLYDSEGDLLYSDLEGNPYVLDSNNRITHYSAMEEDDCFYGFGEKTGELNKNKRFLRERATDAMGYDPEYADTLYKHIPFYIQLRRRTGKAVGVF